MKKNCSGFTLLELILVLIIVGIVTLFSTFGLMEALNSYLTTKEYSEYSLKINIALSRINRELKEILAINKYTNNSISYKRDNQDLSLGLVGNELKINLESNYPTQDKGYVLLDKVSNFQIAPKKEDGNVWQTTDNINSLSKIKVTLTIDISPPLTLDFSINPWFNNTYNGPS